jgi:GTP-binding protein Era
MKSGYIAIIGEPNSGKSTLLNRILGERLSIVTPKAQTTRQRIVGIHNAPGAQMIFLDTPGLHDSEKPLNRFMMGEAGAAVKDADVVCVVVDAADSAMPKKACRFHKGSKCVVALNKLDTILDRPWEAVVGEYRALCGGVEAFGISAKTGHGVDALVAKLAEMLPEGEPFYPCDIYTEHPVRFIAAEMIREQAMLCMHQEIPYSVAVEIEEYREEPHIHRIQASIVVDKDSQKGMVIGSGGQMIKRIGELSRAKIEALVGAKVFLKLLVKVDKNWTRKPRAIKRYFQTSR